MTASDSRRLDDLLRKYASIRSQFRVAGLPENYSNLQSERLIIEQEIERIEPLNLDLAKQREDALDAQFRASENSRQADKILKDS